MVFMAREFFTRHASEQEIYSLLLGTCIYIVVEQTTYSHIIEVHKLVNTVLDYLVTLAQVSQPGIPTLPS